MKSIYKAENSITISRLYSTEIFVVNGKKVKITHDAGNAYEYFYGEVFDGEKFNKIFSLLDMGVIPDNSLYNSSDQRKKMRSQILMIQAKKYIESLFSV